MHAPVLVSAPAEPPVSLTDIKSQLGVTGTGEDALLTGLIAAATGLLDGYAGILGRCLVTQTWRQDFDNFSRVMRVPLPAASVVSIVWTDSNGTVSDPIAGASYDLQADELGSLVRFISTYSFPGGLAETRAVRITFTAGYGAASAVPPALKSAISLMIRKLYSLSKKDVLVDRETVEGVGTTSWSAPEKASAVLDEAISRMIAPYRRVGA